MNLIRTFLSAAWIAASAVLAAGPAHAQAPAAGASPLRLVVGFPPGGALDTLARALVTDLVGGHVPLSTDALGSQLELYRGGKVRILAVSGTRRNPSVPDIPTVREAGVDGFDHANASYSAFVPAGTPADVVQRLEKAFVAAMQKQEVKAAMTRAGLEATGLPGSAVVRALNAEREFWRPLVQASGFRSES